CFRGAPRHWRGRALHPGAAAQRRARVLLAQPSHRAPRSRNVSRRSLAPLPVWSTPVLRAAGRPSGAPLLRSTVPALLHAALRAARPDLRARRQRVEPRALASDTTVLRRLLPLSLSAVARERDRRAPVRRDAVVDPAHAATGRCRGALARRTRTTG